MLFGLTFPHATTGDEFSDAINSETGKPIRAIGGTLHGRAGGTCRCASALWREQV